DADPRHLLEGGGRLGLRLVVAVVVARADVDDADDQLVGGERPPGGRERAERSGPRKAQQQLPAIDLTHELLHSGSFSRGAPRPVGPQPRDGLRLRTARGEPGRRGSSPATKPQESARTKPKEGAD